VRSADAWGEEDTKERRKHTVARGEVVGEARRRYYISAGPQQLETRLEADLHARAREQRDASC